MHVCTHTYIYIYRYACAHMHILVLFSPPAAVHGHSYVYLSSERLHVNMHTHIHASISMSVRDSRSDFPSAVGHGLLAHTRISTCLHNYERMPMHIHACAWIRDNKGRQRTLTSAYTTSGCRVRFSSSLSNMRKPTDAAEASLMWQPG